MKIFVTLDNISALLKAAPALEKVISQFPHFHALVNSARPPVPHFPLVSDTLHQWLVEV